MDNTSDQGMGTEVGWDRRQFLRASGLGVGLLGAGGLLAACTGSANSSNASSASGKPVRGGTLRVGATGGGTTDTLDPQTWGTAPDQLRINQLFDPLVRQDNAGQPQMALATSITPNADATQWTIRIRDGVTTHAGKSFTSADVLFSLQRIMTKKLPGSSVLGPINLAASKVIDSTRLLVAFAKPFGALVEVLAFPEIFMVPRGFDPKKPDGTGPFKFQSYTAGQQSTFVRNENYWRSGRPYLNKVVVVDVSDESTQVSGLQSGQFDVITQLSASSMAALNGSGMKVVANDSGSWVPFTLDCSTKPFSDVRVRQAMRLIVDREQMLQQVFSGKGKIGNDVFSPYDAGYPKDLPQRKQDIAKAKSLLKAAGQSDLRISLDTTPGAPGEVSMAEVFATQAKAAGVTVAVKQHPIGDFYDKFYLKVPFAMDYGPNEPFLVNAGQLMIGKQSYYNANHFDDAEYTALYNKAIAATDATARNDIIAQMARVDYERGGYIVPVFTPSIEAWSPKVGGIEKAVTGVSPGNADFANFWIN